ncbi:Transposase family Tnp2 protein [Ceratobasidium sp. AG-Ba]|nr:Transposase family Tnp2 protein [Ceratobasidium sp. AG-Ba]
MMLPDQLRRGNAEYVARAFNDLGVDLRVKSHHRNQLPVYCPCAKCKGNVKQKPGTIDDHRTRYPQRSASPEPELQNEDVPGSPRASPGPVLSSDEDVRQEDEYMRISSPPVNVPLTPPNHPQPYLQDDIDQGDQPLDIINEDNQEYLFDQLLDEHGPDLDWHHRGVVIEIEPGEQQEAERDPLNAIYDVDFGLGEGTPQNDEAEGLRFELPMEEEPFRDLEGEVEEGIENEELSTAFKEPSMIRNAYIDAFVQKTLYGATHRALQHQLKASRRTISLHPEIQAEDIAKMAQTIRTAERRLGVNLEHIIKMFTLCPLCGRGYSPDYIAGAEHASCLNEGCAGTLFVMRKLASGGQRRVSNQTYPFASPIAWIQHLLSLPGISELLQVWRGDADKEGPSPPIPCEEWIQRIDINKSIGDIHEGWGWRSTKAGLERYRHPVTGDIIDESPLNPPVRFVSLPYGLSLSLNTDWFQANKEGSYSVGACYLAINNLPRHMRFLRENIALCIVMPGPNEPNNYALDQILTPLVDELLELKQGVIMNVRRGDPPVYQEELVHCELTQHIADLIARIKMGGGAGVRSERNFCLYCHGQLSTLSVPAGFIRQDFSFRDPQQERNNAYHWKSLQTVEERKDFFNATGNRFTALHRIPGWDTSTASPPDAMHLLYLGAMNWIVKQVLVGPGMFTKRRPEGRDPQVVFNECLDAMWMPRNFQRLPPKLGQTRTTTKADQWKLTSRILYIPLFLAFRDGDEISPGLVPRAISVLYKRSVTPAEIAFGQRLLESLCIDYIQNNVQLSPNFHYLMHLEEWMLKTGSLYNTHVWGMERANGVVSRIKNMQALPNRTEADNSVIADLTAALRGGTEHALQRGTLMAFIAQCETAYTRLYGIQESTRLSNQSRLVNLEALNLYHMILQFCVEIWPNSGIWGGNGMVQTHYLDPEKTVRNYSYVEYNGIRYGARQHTSGIGYCYGYIDSRYPVLIERILYIEFPGEAELRCICALVRKFQTPLVQPNFPWDAWSVHLGVASWAYNELGAPTIIPIHRFSGTLALFDISMSYGRYWVTVALDSVQPERDDINED